MLLLCQWSGGLPAQAGETRADAYTIKAAFIYNFAKFTNWPDSTAGEMTLCVFGNETMGNALASWQEKEIHNHQVRILQVDSPATAKACQILFIAGDDIGGAVQVLKGTAGAPLLTIGEAEGFAESGGMIGLIEREHHMVFEINISALNAARLKVSSQLLQLAHTTFGTSR